MGPMNFGVDLNPTERNEKYRLASRAALRVWPTHIHPLGVVAAPMDMGIPPLEIKILLESNPLKSRILVQYGDWP